MRLRLIGCLLILAFAATAALAQPDGMDAFPSEEYELDATPGRRSIPEAPDSYEQAPPDVDDEEVSREEVRPRPAGQAEAAADEYSIHPGEPLWPDYYGPPYSSAYDPGFACKGGCSPCQRCCWLPHTWGQFDYLLWWGKSGSLPPLVTTSPIGTPLANAGELDAPGTQILFGDQRINGQVRSGGRLNVGLWLNSEQTLGVGGSFLGMQRLVTHFSASSAGNPILARPFFNVVTGQQDAEVVAYPNIASGIIKSRTSTDFLGAEAYFRELVSRDCHRRLDFIWGYKYAGLDEALSIDDLTDAENPFGTVPVGTRLIGQESFLTRNSFHGPMVGLWYQSRSRYWGWDIFGKLAMGNMHQIVYIQGITDVAVPGAPTFTDPGSLLALPTNMGTHVRDRFGVLPELQITLTRYLTENFRFRFGYTFMYLNNVLRPGQQIDFGVNPSQIGGDPLVGPARPAPQFRATDYWLQGLNFGIEYNW
jgi:hypothetical protein